MNDYTRKCPSIYRGIVEDNNDPLHLGRCRVRVPSVHGPKTASPESLPWARQIVLTPVKKGRGSFVIPDLGDVVWVLFEGAERASPVYLGGTHAESELSLDYDEVLFYTEDDFSLAYNRKSKIYTIVSGDLKLSLGDEVISINGDLHVTGDLNVTGTATVGSLIVKDSAHFRGPVTGIEHPEGGA